MEKYFRANYCNIKTSNVNRFGTVDKLQASVSQVMYSIPTRG